MQARSLFDAADAVRRQFKGRGKLDLEEVSYLTNLRNDIAQMLARLEGAPRYPEDDGLGMFGGVSLGVSLDAVTDVLSQHGLAVAEERLTEDAATGADPWSAIAESVEAEHDWGPLSDEPSPSPRELN
jgi:hypothetical protein